MDLKRFLTIFLVFSIAISIAQAECQFDVGNLFGCEDTCGIPGGPAYFDGPTCYSDPLCTEVCGGPPSPAVTITEPTPVTDHEVGTDVSTTLELTVTEQVEGTFIITVPYDTYGSCSESLIDLTNSYTYAAIEANVGGEDVCIFDITGSLDDISLHDGSNFLVGGPESISLTITTNGAIAGNSYNLEYIALDAASETIASTMLNVEFAEEAPPEAVAVSITGASPSPTTIGDSYTIDVEITDVPTNDFNFVITCPDATNMDCTADSVTLNGETVLFAWDGDLNKYVANINTGLANNLPPYHNGINYLGTSGAGNAAVTLTITSNLVPEGTYDIYFYGIDANNPGSPTTFASTQMGFVGAPPECVADEGDLFGCETTCGTSPAYTNDEGMSCYSDDECSLACSGEPECVATPSCDATCGGTGYSNDEGMSCYSTSECSEVCSPAPECVATPSCDATCGGTGYSNDEGMSCYSDSECSGEPCVAETCEDLIQNQDETDVDCGGTCGPTCENGDSCLLNGDCSSGNCDEGTCGPAAASCSDGILNQDEDGIDCGGVCFIEQGLTCDEGTECDGDYLCTTGSCLFDEGEQKYLCQDHCGNGVRDEEYGEVGVDCGDVCSSPCLQGSECNHDRECDSHYCLDGICQLTDTRTSGNTQQYFFDIGSGLGVYINGDLATSFNTGYDFMIGNTNPNDDHDPTGDDMYLIIHADNVACNPDCATQGDWTPATIDVQTQLAGGSTMKLIMDLELLPGMTKDILIPVFPGTSGAECFDQPSLNFGQMTSGAGDFTTTEKILGENGEWYWVCRGMSNSGAATFGDSGLIVFDENDGSSYSSGADIVFFADYYNLSNSNDKITPGDGGKCYIEFDDNWGTFAQMGGFNGTHYNYTKVGGFASAGTHYFNVTCNDSTSKFTEAKDVQDDLNISGAVPEFSDLGWILAAVLGGGGFILIRKRKHF